MTSTSIPNNPLVLFDAGLLGSPHKRYLVERMLGAPVEGEAEHLLATDTRLGNMVVLTKRSAKLLPAYNAELGLLRACTPHAARLVDTYFEADGKSCIVRGFIAGTPLNDLEITSTNHALKVSDQIARLVHSLHSAKPIGYSSGSLRRNDLVADSDGQIWLINCENAAKLAADNIDQIRLDIRQVGLLALTLITGEDFESSSGDLRAVTENLPPAISLVICRAIDLHGDHQYSSMRWLAQAFENLSAEHEQRHAPRKAISLPAAPKAIFRPVTLKDSAVAHALSILQNHSLTWARLAQRGMQIDQQHVLEALCALDTLDIEPYEHQIQAAREAVCQPGMSAGAILADEVGLGKTIEALMVCQELRVRGLVESALIIASPSGALQWLGETKSRIRCNSYERGFRLYESAKDAGYPLLIISSATLKQERHRAQLIDKRYDLIIVDEAHRCCSGSGGLSALGSAVNALDRKRLLLLTATPLGDRLWDLFTLVDLIRPGLLGSPEDFARECLTPILEKKSLASASAIRSLRARTKTLLIRHKRQDLHGVVIPALQFQIDTEFENSSESKVKRAAELISGRWPSERVVVFAASSADRAAIAEEVTRKQPERTVIQYLGNRKDSREFETRFNDFADAVIISNDVMAEGMNWQRARRLLHFDMPLTPLVWEQRVGRIYRLGQRAESLEIVHLAHPDSLESKILELYCRGLGLFTLPVGEASSVLDYVRDPAHRNLEAFSKLLLRGNIEEPQFVQMLTRLADARAAYDLKQKESAVLNSLYFGASDISGHGNE